MSHAPVLSIVIPCYNEATRLPRTLVATLAFLKELPGTYEIVVVSDGSKDGTVQAAEQALKGAPWNVSSRVLEYTPNAGKGKAVRVGMLEAKGDRILFMDADYSVPLEDLKLGTALLDQGFHIAIGSRALEETEIVEHQSFLRERMAKLFGWIQRSYLGLKLLDTQCGFKLFTREAAHHIFREVRLTSVIFDGEMLWLAKRMGYRVMEFPVTWTHDQDTRISYNITRAIKVLRDMLAIPFLHANRKKLRA